MSARIRSLLLSLSAFMLVACSGSSPSTADPATAPAAAPTPAAPAAPTTGKVTVLLTDGHGNDWDQAIATITSIELIGENGHQTIFNGSATVDLLSLPDYYEVFSIADDVIPDTFKKIRLHIDSLELVELDDEGVVVESLMAHLVGDGEIDLDPRGKFVIAPGDSLYIEIDFDMKKSFKTITKDDGRVILRPVIFVNITREPPFGRLTRLHGTIAEIDADDQSFTLCQAELVAAMRYGGDDDSHDGDDEAGRHCIDVATDEATGVFGADGLPVGFDAVVVDSLVTAVGHLRREERDYDDDDHDHDDDDDYHGDSFAAKFGARYERGMALHAVVVEVGEAFQRVAGIAETIVNGDVFDLALEPGQDLGTEEEILSTQIFTPGTRIFRANGEELDASAIEPGVGVLADGVLVSAEGASDTLRAALLILDLEPGLDEEVLRGEIVSVDVDAGTLQLLVGETEHCVNASEADIFLVSNADVFMSERVGLDDLQPMQSADVFGATDSDTGDYCFRATDILAAAMPGNALPLAAAGADQTVTPGAPVTLDGSGSSDADGDPLTYAWTLVSMPPDSTAALTSTDMALTSFTADLAGDYEVKLVVNDGTENSAPDTVMIRAAPE